MSLKIPVLVNYLFLKFVLNQRTRPMEFLNPALIKNKFCSLKKIGKQKEHFEDKMLIRICKLQKTY